MTLIQEYKTVSGRDRSVFGAFSRDETVHFRVTGENMTEVIMVLHGDGWGRERTIWKEYPFSGTEDGFCAALSMDTLCRETAHDEVGLLYYHYRIRTSFGETLLYGGEAPAVLTPLDPDGQGERQLLVYDAAYRAPAGFGEGILYHIFVDRFAKTGTAWENRKPGAVLDPDWENGIPQYGAYPGAEVANNVFFGGDLYGIAEKLDYIASLGTGTIYLSPVFTAASNHKYDTGDYLSVDPMFGGDEALVHLCREAKKRGIRVILDGVFNHTGSDSIYFNKEGNYPSTGAYQSETSLWSPWYSFRNWPEEYACWWGVKILPRVNSDAASYRDFVYHHVISKWMDAGVSGWRLDVADELSGAFLEGLRTAVREKDPNAVLLGEVWEDASDKVSYGERRRYLQGRQLDGVMNYPLRETILWYILEGDAEALRHGTEYLYRRYPKWASDQQMNFLGTHDTIRILTAIGGEPEGDHTNAELSRMRMTDTERKNAVRRLKTAWGLLCAMPGVPCIFYGDEVGMEGYRDPFCRRPFPWHDMDTDLLAWYRTIGNIRRRESVLQTGVLRMTEVTSDGVILARTPWNGEAHQIIVVVNRCDHPLYLTVPADTWEMIEDRPVRCGDHSIAPGQTVYLRCPAEVPLRGFRFGK